MRKKRENTLRPDFIDYTHESSRKVKQIAYDTMDSLDTIHKEGGEVVNVTYKTEVNRVFSKDPEQTVQVFLKIDYVPKGGSPILPYRVQKAYSIDYVSNVPPIFYEAIEDLQDRYS